MIQIMCGGLLFLFLVIGVCWIDRWVSLIISILLGDPTHIERDMEEADICKSSKQREKFIFPLDNGK